MFALSACSGLLPHDFDYDFENDGADKYSLHFEEDNVLLSLESRYTNRGYVLDKKGRDVSIKYATASTSESSLSVDCETHSEAVNIYLYTRKAISAASVKVTVTLENDKKVTEYFSVSTRDNNYSISYLPSNSAEVEVGDTKQMELWVYLNDQNKVISNVYASYNTSAFRIDAAVSNDKMSAVLDITGYSTTYQTRVGVELHLINGDVVNGNIYVSVVAVNFNVIFEPVGIFEVGSRTPCNISVENSSRSTSKQLQSISISSTNGYILSYSGSAGGTSSFTTELYANTTGSTSLYISAVTTTGEIFTLTYPAYVYAPQAWHIMPLVNSCRAGTECTLTVRLYSDSDSTLTKAFTDVSFTSRYHLTEDKNFGVYTDSFEYIFVPIDSGTEMIEINIVDINGRNYTAGVTFDIASRESGRYYGSSNGVSSVTIGYPTTTRKYMTFFLFDNNQNKAVEFDGWGYECSVSDAVTLVAQSINSDNSLSIAFEARYEFMIATLNVWFTKDGNSYYCPPVTLTA